VGSAVALSDTFFNDVGGAVSNIFASQGYKYKAEGERDQEAQYTAWSTGIKEVQADRDLSNSLGETKADVAGGKSESTFNRVSRLAMTLTEPPPKLA
jgi:hypothetical protein